MTRPVERFSRLVEAWRARVGPLNGLVERLAALGGAPAAPGEPPVEHVERLVAFVEAMGAGGERFAGDREPSTELGERLGVLVEALGVPRERLIVGSERFAAQVSR